MTGKERARELIREYAAGRITYDQFLQQMGDLEVEHVDLTDGGRSEAEIELDLRAQAAIERIRRI